MRLLTLFALTLILGMSSCGDDELPVCIDNILTDFRADACSGGELTTWTFRGELVYCFDFGACLPDKTIDIYRANCELVCELVAGTTNECDGASWAEASNRELVYQK